MEISAARLDAVGIKAQSDPANLDGDVCHTPSEGGRHSSVKKLPSGQIQLFCAFSDQYGNAATAGIESAKLSI